MKSPLKRHGGKGANTGIAKWIVSLMPPRDGSWNRYVEPYFGAGSVLFAMDPEGISEYANDLDGELMRFWSVLQDEAQAEELMRILTCTPLSELQFSASLSWQVPDEVSRAVYFFVRCRQSRQALGKDYVTPTRRTRRGMNEQVSQWLSAVDGLPEAVERLRRVEVWNRPAMSVVTQLDSPQTVFYLDPPYLHETRSTKTEYGKYEMTEGDHKMMLYILEEMQGRFLLSGYRSRLYDEFAARNGWTRHEFQVPNSASSAKHKERKVECVWTNY